MECEVQPQVKSRSSSRKGFCMDCLQITGKGISHRCSMNWVKDGSKRDAGRERKRNLTVLVGKEAEEVQEQIVSVALKGVVERKGNKVRLKEMVGGGKAGMGKMVMVGVETMVTPILSAEVFAEVKKELVLSKNKVDKLCHIIRRNKVNIEPNVRQKLQEIDHLLDEEYETVRVKFLVDEVEEEETQEEGLKKEKKDKKGKTKKTGRQVEVERNVTVLKDAKKFVDRLVEERGIGPEDAVTRISMDGDTTSIKVIANVFSKHQDPEVVLMKKENRGKLCSGVKRAIILCYVEKLGESYTTMRTLMEIMNLGDLPFVIASDFKLINVMLGLCGHGGKYVCCYCEAPKGLHAGKPRTFARLIDCNKRFVDAGSNPKDMMKFFNVINMPLLNMDQDMEVLDVVPIPELHSLMGTVNHLLEVKRKYLASLGNEKKLWDWCSCKGITRRGELGFLWVNRQLPRFGLIPPPFFPSRIYPAMWL